MTLLKVLTRCRVMYDSIEKIAVIFKLMRKRQEMESRFNDYDRNWTTGQKFVGNHEQQRAIF